MDIPLNVLLLILGLCAYNTQGQPLPYASSENILDLEKLYLTFVRMMKDANRKDVDYKPAQYISVLMMSRNEFSSSFDPTAAIKDQGPIGNRFKVYDNKGEEHGEKMMLKELDEVFFKNYTDYEKNPKPLLLVYTTHIPCYRCYSEQCTFCSSELKNDIEQRLKQHRKVYTLVIAFISVYSRMVQIGEGDEKALRYDITDLYKSLKELSTGDIHFAYFMPRNGAIRNLLSNSADSQKKIEGQPGDYTLSPWLHVNDVDSLIDIKRLQAKYPQCCPNLFVQDALYMCLEVFLGRCQCLHAPGKADAGPVFHYDVKQAMRSCFHGDDAPCKGLHNQLSGSLSQNGSPRNILYKCLNNQWLKKLLRVRCNECAGSHQQIARMCVQQAVSAQKIGCPHPTEPTGWVLCENLDTNYGETSLVPQDVRCQMPGMAPEFMCQPPRKRRRGAP